MGKFNNKIEAEFDPPRKWVLSRALTYTNPDIDEDALESVGVKSGKKNCENATSKGQIISNSFWHPRILPTKEPTNLFVRFRIVSIVLSC